MKLFIIHFKEQKKLGLKKFINIFDLKKFKKTYKIF